ncbi:arginine decarboxylase [Geoalkalibacter ferrihydriticus]|uniref:Pyruvoyl-dependent arginine decarboxylase AaxB n=2 Tax=Geoalkalibacter ferrihydriticus TaxID=392333 RepID=A0A0C2EGU4_9BACT|nr:arginine decarboxylase, pyruvoyl-dependent [Geoalkalibacter ferrihydriticus]KIH77873.1 pyruvoyl-dependent arginine decarboxylase [Geoalkalibacter ferrihydriticus DSM 17813]SDL83703.1 arginine decarboxylase [Geoalkalibacter ferrihydriticus]
MFTTPNLHFFTCGSAEAPTRLNSLDAALLTAGLGHANLLKISSVLPPACRFSAPAVLPSGALVPAAYAAITSEMPGEVISAAVAVAYPADAAQPGVIMEYSARGHKEDIEAIVRRMAEEAMRLRGLDIREIRSLAVQHRVEKIGSAFAAVVLWNA